MDVFAEPLVSVAGAVIIGIGGIFTGSLVTLALFPWMAKSVPVEWLDEDHRGVDRGPDVLE